MVEDLHVVADARRDRLQVPCGDGCAEPRDAVGCGIRTNAPVALGLEAVRAVPGGVRGFV